MTLDESCERASSSRSGRGWPACQAAGSVQLRTLRAQWRLRRVVAGGFLAALAAGCEKGEQVELGAPREVPVAYTTIPEGTTDAERFDGVLVSGGMRGPARPSGLNSGDLESGLAATGAGAERWATLPVSWDTPESWEQVEPPRSSMRIADFQVGGAECSVTILGGGGTLFDNVGRWCTQMGIAPLAPSEVAQLPQMRLIGAPATYVDLQGAYSNMGAPAVPGARLLGLIMIQPGEPDRGQDGFAFFVKLAGPEADVTAAEAEFANLCASIRTASNGGGGPRNLSGGDRRRLEPASGGPVGLEGSGIAQSGTAPADAPGPSTGTGLGDSSNGLSWQLPPGWTRGPERAMRVATFMDPSGESCTLSIFGGTYSSNAARWLGEVGQQLPPDGVSGFPRIPSLGREAILIEAAGDHTGMGGVRTPEAYLLGTMCDLGGQMVFLKYVGPRDSVEPRREEFLELARSLQVEGGQ